VPLLTYNAFFLLAVLSLLILQPRFQKAILLLLAWLILPILLIYAFLLHRGTFFAARYILYTLPAYLLLVAYGLDRAAALGVSRSFIKKPMRQTRRASKVFRGSLILPAILLSLVLVPLLLAETYQLLKYYTEDSYEDWRAVGQLLRDNARPGDAVIAVRAEPTMNWYYPSAATSFGAYSRSQPIWEVINRRPRRWFILSSYSIKRDVGLRDWLRQQQAVTIAIDRRVIVYFHEEGQSAAELLAQVKSFTLPQKALTYRFLADQFRVQGDVETSRAFYEKAEQLSERARATDPSKNLWELAQLFEP
jgi:hypothetical protein